MLAGSAHAISNGFDLLYKHIPDATFSIPSQCFAQRQACFSLALRRLFDRVSYLFLFFEATSWQYVAHGGPWGQVRRPTAFDERQNTVFANHSAYPAGRHIHDQSNSVSLACKQQAFPLTGSQWWPT